MMAVYLCEVLHEHSYALLKSKVEIVSDLNRPEIIEGLITRNIKVDKAFMDKLPNLKIIGIHGSGSDDVDMQEAARRHITVFNTPGLNSQSVAEYIVTLMLSLSRHVIGAEYDYITRRNLKLAPAYLSGQELQGKTVGLIGVGAIGKALIPILKYGFNMRILGYSPSFNQEKAEDLGIEYCLNQDTLLQESDYVCLCLPLNKDTSKLIGEAEFKLMKETAFLINTARGAIVDEEALYHALKNKQIAGAASDVLKDEPAFSKLMLLEGMIITPHIAANTNEALKRVGDQCVKQMLEVLNYSTYDFEG